MASKIKIKDWHWEITRKCNLKCLHCLLGDSSSKELSTTDMLKILQNIVAYGGENIWITGGEPLMRKDIEIIIQKAYSLGLKIHLITNATMIDSYFLDKVTRYIQSVAISIDGPQKIHDLIRGKGVYDKNVQAIKSFLDKNIELAVYTTICSLNEKILDVLMSELISIGVERFNFNEINLEGRALENNDLILTKCDHKSRIESILLQLRKNIEIDKFEISSDCEISSNSVYLQANGAIYCCVEISLKSPTQMIANIFDEDIDEKVDSFFFNTDSSKAKCRYLSFYSPGIRINLNRSRVCPIIQ